MEQINHPKNETIKNILEQKVMLPENLTPKQNQIIQGKLNNCCLVIKSNPVNKYFKKVA